MAGEAIGPGMHILDAVHRYGVLFLLLEDEAIFNRRTHYIKSCGLN